MADHPNCVKCRLAFDGKHAKRFSVYDRTLKRWFQYHPKCAPFWPDAMGAVYQVTVKLT